MRLSNCGHERANFSFVAPHRHFYGISASYRICHIRRASVDIGKETIRFDHGSMNLLYREALPSSEDEHRIRIVCVE